MNDVAPPRAPGGPAAERNTQVETGETSSVTRAVIDADSEESPLRRYWRMLVKRRLIVGGIVLLCLLAALVIALMTQRLYSATVTLQIAREESHVVDINQDREQRQFDPEFYQTQYSLLKSRSLAEAVVRDLRLAQNDDFLTNYGRTSVSSLPSDRDARIQIATDIVMANLEVVPVRLSSVVAVSFHIPNAAMAAAVANSVAENFIRSNIARRFEATRYAREFLQTRLNEMRQRLEESERRAAAYAGQNRIINIAPVQTGPGPGQGEQSLVGASLTQANQSLAEARAARVAAESRYRQGVGQPGQANELLQNPALNAVRQQRADISGQYQSLLSQFGPSYPQVIALRARLSELQRQVDAESRRINTSVSGDLAGQYHQALANERGMQAIVDRLRNEALDLRQRSIQYNIFQRDADTNRQLYDALLQRFKEVGIAGGVGTNNVSIVDRALAPGGPYRPDLRLNLLLGLIIGLLLGAIIALILEQFEEYALVPSEFQAKLGVPLLGSVPIADKGVDPADLLEDSKSPVSEAYFSILAALRFSTSHGTPKSFVITSTQPGEGKTTSSIALARNLARVGKRVLLVDADLRNPSLHKKFNIENASGFSNLLVGDGTLEQHTVAGRIPNLTLLTSGPIPPNPAELLAGVSLQDFVSAMESRYDHVVIDAPPVLGLADAPLLARAAEATVFVVEASRTRNSQARQALNRITGLRAVLVGAILTKLNVQKAGYGYGYGYDYEYGKRA